MVNRQNPDGKSAARAGIWPPPDVDGQTASLSSMRRPNLLSTAPGTTRAAYSVADWGLLGGISLIWGSSFLLIALGLEAFPPPVVTSLRLLIGAATLAMVPASRHRVNRADLPRIALLGVVWMAFPMLMFPIAEQWISSSLAGMLNGSMPIFSALVAAFLLRRSPGRPQMVGLLLGLAGIVAVSLPTVGGGASVVRGTLMVLAATISYGLAVNLAVPLQQQYGAFPVVFRAQLAAIVIVVPIGLTQLSGATFAWGPFAAVAALGVFGTGVAQLAMSVLAGRVGATRASIAIYFLPVVAILLGVLLHGEHVAGLSIVGTAMVVCGAFLASRAEH